MCTPSCQPPPFDLLDVDRVVEIAGIIGIDRDDELLAQILAPVERDASTVSGIRLGFLEDASWKFGGKMVFPDDREHVDAGRRCGAEHFDDFPFRIDVARFPRFEPDDYLVATRPVCRGLRSEADLHVNVVHDARIVGHDVEEILRSAAKCRRRSRGRASESG